jgi:hypothetical protein
MQYIALVWDLVWDWGAKFWDWGAKWHGFEFLMAAFTLILAFFTGTLWWATRKLVRASPRIERAYISAGLGGREDHRFCPGINNYGKTPATVHHILIGICEVAELPTIPEIHKRQWVNYSIPPTPRTIPAHNTWIVATSPIGDNTVFFGRIWYTDIFNEMHQSGFALYVGREGVPAVDAPAYWVWD